MTGQRAQATEAERWLDALDPEQTPGQDASDLAAIGRVSMARRRAEAELEALVWDARAGGKSWAMIGLALGVSKQAAQHKYASVASGPRPRGDAEAPRQVRGA